MSIDVLTVSSKGQVVLPAGIRKNLSIEAGSKLAVYAADDFIMFKVLRLPDVDNFRNKLDEARAWAESVGYAEGDVDAVIKSAREKKRK